MAYYLRIDHYYCYEADCNCGYDTNSILTVETCIKITSSSLFFRVFTCALLTVKSLDIKLLYHETVAAALGQSGRLHCPLHQIADNLNASTEITI